MKKFFTTFLSVSLLFLVPCSLLLAQSEYPHVMDNGGGLSENTSYKNIASIGQAVIGVASNPSNINQAGYITAVDIFLDIKEDPTVAQLPTEISIGKPYPNPFNPTCQIKVKVPELSEISFEVFDLLGRSIFTESKNCKGGTYRLIFNAEGLPSGVYLYRISVGKTVSDGKFMLVK